MVKSHKILFSATILLIIFSYLGSNTTQNTIDEPKVVTINNKFSLVNKSSLVSIPSHNNYELWLDSDSNKYEFIFSPFLEHSDSAIYSFFLDSIDATYKDDSISIPLNLSIENINNVGVIVAKSNKYKYFAIPAKEDSGEIHSIVFWREKI